MDLLRHWRRRTFGAAIGALIVPTAIVAAAVAVGVGGGGLGGLRSIGQAFTGPDLPALSPSAARAPAGNAGRLLARVEQRERRALRSGGVAPSGPAATPTGNTQLAAAPPATARPESGGGSRPQPGTQGPAGGTPPPAATPTTPPPATAPAATPTVAPTPPPSPLRQIGDGVTSITDRVPIAGPPVSGVVDLLVDTVDGLTAP